uniref:Transposase MuDR plant domain-containing protein n=1 Tax=Lactuca sativa TaxID=4236 RepID=A0A9R1XTR0_LACSA|nr:hypothetical protein LSAT_V11C300124440 [Lactuca sativa]
MGMLQVVHKLDKQEEQLCKVHLDSNFPFTKLPNIKYIGCEVHYVDYVDTYEFYIHEIEAIMLKLGYPSPQMNEIDVINLSKYIPHKKFIEVYTKHGKKNSLTYFMSPNAKGKVVIEESPEDDVKEAEVHYRKVRIGNSKIGDGSCSKRLNLDVIDKLKKKTSDQDVTIGEGSTSKNVDNIHNVVDEISGVKDATTSVLNNEVITKIDNFRDEMNGGQDNKDIEGHYNTHDNDLFDNLMEPFIGNDLHEQEHLDYEDEVSNSEDDEFEDKYDEDYIMDEENNIHYVDVDIDDFILNFDSDVEGGGYINDTHVGDEPRDMTGILWMKDLIKTTKEQLLSKSWEKKKGTTLEKYTKLMALYSGFVPISNKGQVCSQVTTSKSKGKELHLQKKLNMDLKSYSHMITDKEIRACTATSSGAKSTHSFESYTGLISKEILGRCFMDKVFREKYLVRKHVIGDYTRQYELLMDYVLELQPTNFDTTVKTDACSEPNHASLTRQFRSPLQIGFKLGLRDLLGLDCSFTKGPFLGQVLSTVGLDSINGIYPLPLSLKTQVAGSIMAIIAQLFTNVHHRWNAGDKYQITRVLQDQHVVDVRKNHYSCRKCKLIGITWKHENATLNEMSKDSEDELEIYKLVHKMHGKYHTYLRWSQSRVDPCRPKVISIKENSSPTSHSCGKA